MDLTSRSTVVRASAVMPFTTPAASPARTEMLSGMLPLRWNNPILALHAESLRRNGYREIHESASLLVWVRSDIGHSAPFGALGRLSSFAAPLISRLSGSSFFEGSSEVAEECQNQQCATPLNRKEQKHYDPS